ncbi:hypothetical protein B5F41_01550 [Gordonibacter sp. An232A]|nr:hypothetical protein B5F41_01550 [Gordonibacter sp. An232A]
MAQSRQKFAFARCGASVALAATLSLSMVPATALAEVDSDAQGGRSQQRQLTSCRPPMASTLRRARLMPRS